MKLPAHSTHSLNDALDTEDYSTAISRGDLDDHAMPRSVRQYKHALTNTQPVKIGSSNVQESMGCRGLYDHWSNSPAE